MRWGREEQKPKNREKQQLEKSQPEKQKQPSPSPLLHQHQGQQDKEGRSSSSSSPFSLFTPSSWISKLKQSLTTSKSISKGQQLPTPKQNHHHHQHQLNSPRFRIKPNEPVSQPTRDRRRKLDKSARAESTTASGSKAHQVQPLSPPHPARISSVSDHYISFFPSDLDDVVLFPPRRSYERLPGGGFNGLYQARDRAPDRRPRGLNIDPFGIYRVEPAVPELKRSESAKLTRIASDLTTASTVHDSPKVRRPGDVRLRPEKKGIGSGAGSCREEFQIRPIDTAPASSTQSINTAPAASRGSRLPSDLNQVQDQRRKSFSNSIGHKLRRKSKVRVHSPRVGAGTTKKKGSAEAAALAESEKPKKAVGKTTTGAPSQLESFAVVKCSSDPRRDFRDSMVEMISELGMARPEELEGLLACYLSLNADEYHDVIVRVFRQVWLDLILDSASTTASSPRQHQRMSA